MLGHLFNPGGVVFGGGGLAELNVNVSVSLAQPTCKLQQILFQLPYLISVYVISVYFKYPSYFFFIFYIENLNNE